jgi:hypothetical protein
MVLSLHPFMPSDGGTAGSYVTKSSIERGLAALEFEWRLQIIVNLIEHHNTNGSGDAAA